MAMAMTHAMDADEVKGIPWFKQPLKLHSARKYSCSLSPQQCEYQQGYWRFWYELDHRYALPTVALFLAVIVLASIPYLLAPFVSTKTTRFPLARKLRALARYASYRSFRIPLLNWNSAPLGVLFLGAVGVVFFFSMVLGPRPYYWPNRKDPPLSFGNSPPLAARSGWMALACLPFIIATSSKSNLITALTGVSHERLQVFHRWISYACFVLALLHTFPFIVYRTWKGDVQQQWDDTIYYWTGSIALIAQFWLTFASFSPLRNWCYEFFKFTHFFAALVFVVFFFFHCNFTLTSVDYFIATGVIFSLTWLHSQSRIYFQHGFKKATIHLTTNGFIKVTIPTQTTWLAGQHYFIRFLGLGLHATTAHPFTVCSLPTKAHYYEAAESDLVFYIRAQGGLTARLASYAKNHPNTTIRVLLDGPYGGIDMTKLATSHKILAIAGGSGAGWLLPLLGAFLRRRDCVTSGCDPATGKMGEACGDDGPEMRVVLATRDMATRNWFEEAVADLLSQSLIGCCPSGLSVEIYCTGSQAVDAAPALSPHIITVSEDVDEKDSAISPEVRERNAESSKADSEKKEGSFTLSPRDFSTRPDLPTIVAATAATSSSSESTSPNNRCDMAVFCCGPLSMQSDVANAVAKEQLQGLRAAKAKDVYLHLEHFSWA